MALFSANETPVCEATQRRADADGCEYYDDRRGERGNLRAHTLHYPGRPHYKRLERDTEPRSQHKRYYHVCGKWSERDAVSERGERYCEMLRSNPGDVDLWLQYIHFLEEHGAEGAALAAAERAEERLEGVPRNLLRATRLRVASYSMQHHQYTDLLKQLINKEDDTGVWGHAILAADTATGARAATATAITRAHTTLQYMHLLYVYGGFLRAAGMYEQLVLLLELMLAMNCPPPPRPSPCSRDVGDDMGETSTAVLPLSTLWPRAERLRAARAWRPRPMSAAHGDPQCCPMPADVAPLLRPVPSMFLLLLTTLRLIKVPLSPHTQYLMVALHGFHTDLAQVADHDTACLLPLLEARSATDSTRTAALCARWASPPHYLHDEYGYLSWVEWIWDCGCHWTEGEEREALLCWRIRWHSMLLRQVKGQSQSHDGESRRVRRMLKTALKSWGTPLAFAEYSRLTSDRDEGTRVCLTAFRQSPIDANKEHLLYISRIMCENDDAPVGLWATCCAALGLKIPDDDSLIRPPPSELRNRALHECDQRCDNFEARTRAINVDEHVHRLLLPSEGEWPRARARLANVTRLRALCESDRPPRALDSADSKRWREENTEGLVLAARSHPGLSSVHARRMRHAYPHNATLAYEAGRVPLWRTTGDASHIVGAVGAAGETLPALGELLPALCHAENEGWTVAAARRLLRASRRLVSRGAGCPLLWTVLAAAEAAAGDVRGAVGRGVLCHPQHKWLYVTGAECGALPAMEAADLLLERELRVHVLPQELESLPPRRND